MTKTRVIVCEQSGRWAAALRPHLPGEIRLRETRSLAECAAELAAAPESLLALELARDNLADVLTLLGELGRTAPQARVVVLAGRGWEAYEWLLREAGAVYFTASPRDPAALARLAVRHAARFPASKADLATQIAESLPWSNVAATA